MSGVESEGGLGRNQEEEVSLDVSHSLLDVFLQGHGRPGFKSILTVADRAGTTHRPSTTISDSSFISAYALKVMGVNIQKFVPGLQTKDIRLDQYLTIMHPQSKKGPCSDPGDFEVCTVLFSDMVSFTTTCCKPILIGHMFNSMYSRFDQLTSIHNVYKRSRHPETQRPRHPDTQTSRAPELQTSRHPDIQRPRDPDIQRSEMGSEGRVKGRGWEVGVGE
ncbi:hypothetical protein CRUP_029676 [Coryphaenoides rupestris]|nr:hypothetical protein CRUP_029676 [Coryphaenoides rupestris]